MEYKMGNCIGISRRQVRRRKGSARWGRVQLRREHHEAFKSSQGAWEKEVLLQCDEEEGRLSIREVVCK